MQVLQLGLTPSQRSFLFLQIVQAKRFGLGTLVLEPAGTAETGLSVIGVSSEPGDTESFAAAEVEGSAPGGDMVAVFEM